MAPTPFSRLLTKIQLGFDWGFLPRGAVIVDVGGGIGSTSMLLAEAYAGPGNDRGLKFIIQDRPPVVAMGEKVHYFCCPFQTSSTKVCAQAWKEKYPGLIERGTTTFQGESIPSIRPGINLKSVSSP